MGCPSSEATGDGKGTRLTEEATVGCLEAGGMPLASSWMCGGLRAAKLPWSTPTLTEDHRQSSMLGTESAPDDGIPEFLRRTKAKGAAGDRPRDAGGMASERTIAEEEGEWTL